MMKLGIRKTGGSTVDMVKLTAMPDDVAVGAKFYGAGSDDVRTGTVADNPIINKKLGANESYTIPSGIIRPGSRVYQEIQKQAGMTITPVAAGSLAGVQGKYMTGDILVDGVDNLIPANIRHGAFIGSVAGTWEGFVNNDPLTPYWRGIFAPGQTGVLTDNKAATPGSIYDPHIDWNSWQSQTSQDGDYIAMISRAGTPGYKCLYYPAFRFAVPIEMEGVRSVTIRYRLPAHSANNYTWIIISQNTARPIAGAGWVIDPELGPHEKFTLPATGEYTWAERTFPLNNAGRYHYIHVGLGVAPSYSQGRWIDVNYIRLNK